MDFLQKINLVWQKVGIVQKALLFAIVMACILTGLLLTKWATKAEMKLLYANLSPETADGISAELSSRGVDYNRPGGGNSIYVPAKMVYELKLDMAKEGLVGGDQKGYSLFDNQRIGVSPLVQQMNLNRAEQDELAKTIQMIDGVLYARVHIVRGEQNVFSSEQKPPTASVFLKLKPGWQFNRATVGTITNFVSGAIDGLEPENVTVADSQNNLLSTQTSDNGIVTSANTFMDYKMRVEQSLSAKVQTMLETVLGPGRSTVEVSAKIDMEHETTTTTTYEEGIKTEMVTNSTENKTPSTTDKDGNILSAGNTESSEIIESKLVVPETTITKMGTPGEIMSVSVSAVVDLNKAVAAAEGDDQEGASAAAATGEKIMTVEQVEALIRNAIGPELLGTDKAALTVVDIPFNRPDLPPMDEDQGKYEKMTQYIEIARQSSMGLLAICALLALKIFSGAKKKVSAEDQGQNANMLDSAAVGMLPAGVDSNGISGYRQHIAGAIKQDPEQVKQLFSSWLTEDR